MINNETHHLLDILTSASERILRIRLRHGPIFSVKVKYPIDTDIYGEDGGWSGEIVSMLSDPENKFHRPGNGLDFYEEDIVEIVDEIKGDVIYKR